MLGANSGRIHKLHGWQNMKPAEDKEKNILEDVVSQLKEEHNYQLSTRHLCTDVYDNNSIVGNSSLRLHICFQPNKLSKNSKYLYL